MCCIFNVVQHCNNMVAGLSQACNTTTPWNYNFTSLVQSNPCASFLILCEGYTRDFLYSVRVTHVISYTLWGWHTCFISYTLWGWHTWFISYAVWEWHTLFLILCENDTRDFLYSVRVTHVISYTLWGWHTWFIILYEGDTRDFTTFVPLSDVK
jgi:hypothetical protein